MYSTLNDLQTWVENYASPELGSPEIFEEMMTSYVLSDGEETGYGYGLSVDDQRGLKRVHHGGADVAHRSMLAYYPEINAGITTQSNHAGFNSAVAYELAAAFFADAMEPEEEAEEEAAEGEFDPHDYDPEALADFEGRYFSDEVETFYTIVMQDGELVMQQRRLDDATLTPGQPDTFSGGGFTFRFERDRNDQVIGFYLSSGRTRDVRFGRVR